MRADDGTTPRGLAVQLGRSVFGTTMEVYRLVELGLLVVPGRPPAQAGGQAVTMSFIRAVAGGKGSDGEEDRRYPPGRTMSHSWTRPRSPLNRPFLASNLPDLAWSPAGPNARASLVQAAALAELPEPVEYLAQDVDRRRLAGAAGSLRPRRVVLRLVTHWQALPGGSDGSRPGGHGRVPVRTVARAR